MQSIESLASTFSMRTMARIGSTFSVICQVRVGNEIDGLNLSNLGFNHIGSNLSLRSFSRFGSALSQEAGNGPNIDWQGKIHSGIPRGLRNISETPENKGIRLLLGRAK